MMIEYFCFLKAFLPSDNKKNHLMIVLFSKALPTIFVPCWIMGWPEIPCCGVFCNCDERVTQMLNRAVVYKYCFRWTVLQGDKAQCSSYARGHQSATSFQESPHLHTGNFLTQKPSRSLRVPTLHPHPRTEGGGSHQTQRCQKSEILRH